MLKLHFFAIFFSLFFNNSSYSQQGKVDLAFNVLDDGLQGDGFDSTVRTVALQADGKLIVGGDFLNFNGAVTPYLCRLFSDGSKDISFGLGSGFNGKIYCSILLPDGKIILGGSFTAFDGSAAGRLIRLNSDGSFDATFNTSVAASTGIVHGLALQTDGSIVIVGSFTKYNGITVNHIARILPNGNLDTSFVTGSGASANVDEVQIQTDGKIIVAGSFISFNGTICNRIIRLNSNGSIDAAFGIGTSFNDNIGALSLQPNGKILVGGDFTSYNGTAANRIIRLNTDGSIDSSFISGSGFSTVGVNSIKVDSSGSIMVAGSFTGNYNGTAVNRLVLLGFNGVINPLFDIGFGPSSATVYALADAPDGSWFVGGSFSVFDSQNQGRLAKIDAVGTLDIGYLTAGVGFDNSVLKIISLPDNKTMAFGSFTKFNGGSVNRIACLLEDGAIDPTFNSSGIGANNVIKSAVIQTDNKMVLVGSFTNYNGVVANRIIRTLLNGDLDATFTIGTGTNNQIYAVALQPDGKIIIAGNFTNYNGVSVNRIARLLPDGAIDVSFNTGLGADAIVETLLLQPDGKIILGGRFTTFNGLSYNKIVRLNTDGSTDFGFVIGTGFDKYVYTIAIQSDNKLIFGGTFLNYGGASAKRIIRLNSNGSLDTSFTSGAGFSSGEVRTILVQPDNRLLIGGTFSGTYNGTAVKRMVRLMATGVYDTTFSVNLNGTLYSVCFTPNNKVMIGGNFNSISGITKHRIARIKLCTNSSIWDGIAWSNGLPSPEKTILFNGSFPFFNSTNACSCSINLGNTVTIPNGNTLGLIFDYAGSGTLVLENNAALYQSDDQIINTGNIRIKRQTTPILKTDYTYWCSPASNQKLIDVSPLTLLDKFYSFDASADNWNNETPTNVMGTGNGYIIRGPENYSTIIPSIYEAVFSGVPNNGIVSVPIATTDTSNLIGNPYPSAIDADVFITTNAGVTDGTIYLWTHNTAITNNAYTSDDYAVYNLLGGVGTSAALKLGINNTKPNGKIASGQAFFVTSINGGGAVIFNNSMRVAGNNSSFFKSNAIKKQNQINVEKDRIWLNLSNSQGAFKQTLIGYIEGATNDYDTSFDGESFDGNEYIDFYSINQDKNLAIQGRALPFKETDVIPLGYSTTIEGVFTINIDAVDGLLSDQVVFIEDKLNNTFFDLKSGSYTFNTEIGAFNNRFVLRFTDKTLAVKTFQTEKDSILVFNKNKQIQVYSTAELIDKIILYDLSGRKIYQKNNIDSIGFSVPNLGTNQSIGLVKIILQNGHTVVKKIIY
ncbi:delta-60 repeat domain-containing protein [Flavobacterium sp. AED]|uniref:delta-60 repeat domain-containing protein n=1 Tax=Flavobacterium sp. AED TaxID=1423323 RepID=UPI00057FFAB4|nr:delta-60 repeat domain-containing protein [Flavobacterium sp. AED]KIA84878.1 calcium-binding protein [Flavobacterium sp. AED]